MSEGERLQCPTGMVCGLSNSEQVSTLGDFIWWESVRLGVGTTGFKECVNVMVQRGRENDAP